MENLRSGFVNSKKSNKLTAIGIAGLVLTVVMILFVMLCGKFFSRNIRNYAKDDIENDSKNLSEDNWYRKAIKAAGGTLPPNARSLRPKQIIGIYKSFRKNDADGNGTISSEELKAAMKTMNRNFNTSQIQKIMADMDTDKSGAIDFFEYLNVAAEMVADDIAYLKAFNTIDLDGSGEISAEEMAVAMKQMNINVSPQYIHEIIKDMGTKKKDVINFEEFKKIIAWKANQSNSVNGDLSSVSGESTILTK
ncbi:DgyrCDS4438 [Dimorphilus gyrociliatus]|uniref:DgyrCDS4438 n=1 Tax=Dimorphilus gyrociliatus TaxID=2664684 RepID=A0A7I8VGJ7_9ANNE|nr:DgyrCDS4438 [Dimorphilus gyrociliatus]